MFWARIGNEEWIGALFPSSISSFSRVFCLRTHQTVLLQVYAGGRQTRAPRSVTQVVLPITCSTNNNDGERMPTDAPPPPHPSPFTAHPPESFSLYFFLLLLETCESRFLPFNTCIVARRQKMMSSILMEKNCFVDFFSLMRFTSQHGTLCVCVWG